MSTIIDAKGRAVKVTYKLRKKIITPQDDEYRCNGCPYRGGRNCNVPVCPKNDKGDET